MGCLLKRSKGHLVAIIIWKNSRGDRVCKNLKDQGTWDHRDTGGEPNQNKGLKLVDPSQPY